MLQRIFRAALVTAVILAFPAAGNAEDAQDWATSVSAAIKKSVIFPMSSARRTGLVLIRLQLDRQGRLVQVHVKTSSCVEEFDREALAAIKRAEPFAPPPPEMKLDEGLDLPLYFGLPVTTPRAQSPTGCPTPEERDREKDKALGLHPPS